MRFAFKTKKLQALYEDEKGASGYPEGVVAAFFDAMAIIKAAADERDLYALKSLHYELLQGTRGKRGHRSIRLNDQYRLVLAMQQDSQGRYCLIVSLEKHYR